MAHQQVLVDLPISKKAISQKELDRKEAKVANCIRPMTFLSGDEVNQVRTNFPKSYEKWTTGDDFELKNNYLGGMRGRHNTSPDSKGKIRNPSKDLNPLQGN